MSYLIPYSTNPIRRKVPWFLLFMMLIFISSFNNLSFTSFIYVCECRLLVYYIDYFVRTCTSNVLIILMLLFSVKMKSKVSLVTTVGRHFWGRIWRHQLSDTLQIQFKISQGQTDVNSMQYIISNLNTCEMLRHSYSTSVPKYGIMREFVIESWNCQE